ncbi:MAG: hypothetical protein PVH88_14105 [Ignavibacteria bacterium]|jgi:hypothetical protein
MSVTKKGKTEKTKSIKKISKSKKELDNWIENKVEELSWYMGDKLIKNRSELNDR